MPTPTRTPSSSTSSGFDLSKATAVGRNIVKFGGIILVVLMVGRLLVNSLVAFWEATHPEPPPPPTMGFGVLPPIQFGEGSAVKPASYVLELPGAIPLFPDRATVYFMPKTQLGLLSLESAKTVAARLGFMTEPTALSDRLYRWRRLDEVNSMLEMDTVTNNLSFATDYLTRPEAQVGGELPTTFDAVQTTKQFLSSSNLLPADMATPAGETEFLKITGGALQEAVSLSDSQVIRVNLFRAPLNGIQTFTKDAKTGLVSADIASLNGRASVIRLDRNYAPIERAITHSYPLRSAAEAWQIMQAGEGYVAAANRSDIATIRSVHLGYFDDASQEYLMPIYVFFGDNGFVGYVSALDPSVVESSAPTL